MSRRLDSIDSPQDLHGLSDEELQEVAQDVREHIIDTVGEIGGHFGANLGACELAVAIHSLLDSPKDKVLWDVGHQAYPHTILTGRRDELAPMCPPVCEQPSIRRSRISAASWGSWSRRRRFRSAGPWMEASRDISQEFLVTI
jgi:hypothetical protein